jgi:hypothetical protein
LTPFTAGDLVQGFRRQGGAPRAVDQQGHLRLPRGQRQSGGHGRTTIWGSGTQEPLQYVFGPYPGKIVRTQRRFH